MYAHRFRVYFTPHQGCFSPFPHGTRSLSVTRESLALEGGPPGFTPDYSSRALLRNSTTPGAWSSPTGLSPSLAERSSCTSADVALRVCGSYNPAATRTSVWALPVSLAATWGISVDFSFLQVLRCFSSLGWLSGLAPGVTVLADGRVSPFGHPGVKACVPLSRAYRSLPRPSSPSCA